MAGTEDGIKEPQATFSACFGAAFIMLHPTKYAAMLAEKMQKHGATGWLVNTGWSGGRYASVLDTLNTFSKEKKKKPIHIFHPTGMAKGTALSYHTQGRSSTQFTLASF